MKKKFFLGLDPGFSDVKYAYRKDEKMEMGKFPSVVAKTKHYAPDLIYYNGDYYYVGSAARLQPNETIQEIRDYASLRKHIPVLVTEVLKRIEIDPEEYDITIATGLSLAHENNSNEFKDTLSNFSVDNKDIKLNVLLLPQGFGAMKTLMNVKETRIYENFGIIDNGFNTLDVLIAINKEVRVDRLRGYEGRGVIGIAEKIKSHIHTMFHRSISIKEAADIMNTGSYKLRGKTHDMTHIVKKMKEEYTKEFMDFLEKNYGNELDKFDVFFFVGGGAYFIDERYADNIKVVKKPEYYNAIGNLLHAEQKR